MSDGVIHSCGLAGPGASRGTMARSNGRHVVIDIHCHLAIPAADAMMRPHQNPGAISISSFTSPGSVASPADSGSDNWSAS